MSVLLAVAIAVVMGVGAWLLLDRDLVRVALGALLAGHAAVLVLTTTRAAGEAPLLNAEGAAPAAVADPLPQALALTAIVISFGVGTLVLALAGRLLGNDRAPVARHGTTTGAGNADSDLVSVATDDDGPPDGDEATTMELTR